MSIESNLEKLKENIPAGVKLVAVSKFHSNESIMEAYKAGHRVFGENRVQELIIKYQSLPKDIEWHLIGHLQSNKIKTIVPFVDTIQSVDSWKLLQEINSVATKANRVINCLLEIHIACEASKFGFKYEEARNLLQKEEWRHLSNIKIVGLMGMASNTDDEQQIVSEFKELKLFFDEVKQAFFSEDTSFSELSMGMSHDYILAIREGATIVRVGSAIFGEREF